MRGSVMMHVPLFACVARIWAAVARLSPDGAQLAADVAPAKTKLAWCMLLDLAGGDPR